MSNTSSGDAEKLMEKPDNDLSKAMGNLSVITGDSDKISSPKNLCDMPFDVVGLIIERSDYKEQLILRKVSKSLRSLVDQQKPSFKNLHFYVSLNLITLWFDDQKVVYTSRLLSKISENMRGEHGVLVLRDDYEKIALDDLASTLKNPKLQLDKFEFGYDRLLDESNSIESAQKKINKQLKSINRLCTVKKLNVLDVSDLPTILPYLKPRALKTITICFDRERLSWNYGAALKAMEQVESLEQWKNVEEFIVGIPFEDFPMRYARHFKRFIIKEHAISNDLLLRMRDYFSKCVNFEGCIIFHCNSPSDDVMRYEIGTHVASERWVMIHYSIPDSEHYLEFKFLRHNVTIEKKKKLF